LFASHDVQFTLTLAFQSAVLFAAALAVRHLAQQEGAIGNDTGWLNRHSLVDYFEFLAHYAIIYYKVILTRFAVSAIPTPTNGAHWGAILLFVVVSGAPVGGWRGSIVGETRTVGRVYRPL
jgi:hypothetical protein